MSRFGFENWSHDGKYLYAEDYSDKADDMVRVSVPGGKVERLLSLKDSSSRLRSLGILGRAGAR